MIYDGSLCASSIAGGVAGGGVLGGQQNLALWAALAIGLLIVVWILAGVRNLDKLNFCAALALFGLTIFLCVKVAAAFAGGVAAQNALSSPAMTELGAVGAGEISGAEDAAGQALSFGAAIELSAAMPLSWLPVISDYTKDAKRPIAASLAAALVYFFVSVWMYAIGMAAAIWTGELAIDVVMIKAGLGFAGLAIVVLSTVTTTYLDAYSAGVSWQSVLPREGAKFYAKAVAIFVAVLGTAGAILFNMDNITDFLYLIGSVFAPMTAILLADFFVLRKDSSQKKIDASRFAVWAAGFALYQVFLRLDLPFGATLPAMAATFALALLTRPKRVGII